MPEPHIMSLNSLIFHEISVVELSLIALLLLALLLILRARRRKGKFRLERDPSGFWRYHAETEFNRRLAYGRRISASSNPSKEVLKPSAVIHFDGDVRGRAHKALAALVDEIEVNREELGGVVVVVNSPGGAVPTYGHAFSQMERIRQMELPLTVCIDVVAASGGYLVSLPANKIIAAPFAIVGSVGVMAFVPNFRNFLLEKNIQPRTFTAGKFKRTISLTDDATPEEVERFKQQLEVIHRLFLGALKQYRPAASLEHIETGDHWTARESIDLNLGLVDELGTSQEYLLKLNRTHDLVLISQKKGLFEQKFAFLASAVGDRLTLSPNHVIY